jgi:hypothetical protein
MLILSSNAFSFIIPYHNKQHQISSPTITIHLAPYSLVYEGDIIHCTITGETTETYWKINNNSEHYLFHDNNPLIYDPEPTPLESTYVTLTIYAENEYGNDKKTIPITLKRLYFGDIHWHTPISDGNYDIDTMYQNAITDNYLDFTACSDHAELIDGFNIKFGGMPKWDWIKTLLQKILRKSEWQQIKEKANEYYTPAAFTTLLGFEWTAAQWSLGGKPWSPHGWEDVGHINFYFKDIYENASEYSDLQKLNYDQILEAMTNEWHQGHYNIGYPHHSLGRAQGSRINFTTNWSYLANNIQNKDARNIIIRGAECYSRWGTSIGGYLTPNVPLLWPYKPKQFTNQTDAWVENALWEWSQPSMKNQRFSLIASSDTHDCDRPGSAQYNHSHLAGTSGILAVYAIHNTREEIWDAMNNCTTYASQLLKIRANAHYNGQLASGQWINCTSPLIINITAHATFPGEDHGKKSMCPHGYNETQLNYPLSDIWLIKKDTDKGRPWCKVIGHVTPNTNVSVITFTDPDVQPNDFYWVAIRQKGESLSPENNEYMTFLSPVFIDTVIPD